MKMYSRLFLVVLYCVAQVGVMHAVAEPSLVDRVVVLRPEESSADLFKKAHSALVYDPSKIIIENDITRYEQADSSLYWRGVWWAFLSGMLLMLTSLGLFVLIFVVGLMHQFRFKELFVEFKLGTCFAGGFTVCYALLQYYTFQISQLFDIWLVQALFSAVVTGIVAWYSLLLLGLFYDHTHPQSFRPEVPYLRDYVGVTFLGTVAAWFMLSQKNSLLFSFARQSMLSVLSGSGFVLSVGVACGAGCLVMLYWMVSAYFLKEDHVNLWFSDAVSLLSWIALYMLVEVLSPLVLVWHAALLSIIVLLLAGSYFWSSARTEMTYHYFKEYSKATTDGSLNHLIAGFRMFNPRVVCKRFCAVVAFALIVPSIGKLYLAYNRFTIRQAVIQAIKSM